MLRLLGLLSLVALVLAGCKPQAHWRQKLTLVVETPAGEVMGSSVSEVRVWMGPEIFMETAGVTNRVTAEAAFVEVTPGIYLFALLDVGVSFEMYAPISVEEDHATRLRMIERQFGKPAKEIPPEHWPRLVTFDDLADPTTVRPVDPDDLAATFGPGVRLKTIMLEITPEPTTIGPLDELLPWLGPYPEAALLPKIDPYDWSLKATLRHGDFIRRPR